MLNKGKKPKKSRNSAGERFALLAGAGEQVFHTKDLANLWGIRNSHTLYMTLSRYVAAGLMFRVHKGLYSINHPSNIDPYLLGLKALHSPGYISCESVLFNEGVINQTPHEITLVSDLSKRFAVAGQHFRSRKLRNSFLFNEAGIVTKNSVRIATLPRAIADTLYFNPKKYFDASSTKIINMAEVRDMATRIGYSISA